MYELFLRNMLRHSALIRLGLSLVILVPLWLAIIWAVQFP